MNYPNQDDYETEEEFNEAQELYWMELDRQYEEWKDEQLEVVGIFASIGYFFSRLFKQ